MVCVAEALEDIVQECVTSYVLPRKHMVNVLGLLYLTAT
jgi:hypothetical protein